MAARSQIRLSDTVDKAFKPMQAALSRLEDSLRQRPRPPAILCHIDPKSDNGLPESFAIEVKGKDIHINAADKVGLAYALEELAAIFLMSPNDARERELPLRITPYCRFRGLTYFRHNKLLEEEYFHSPQYWDTYFALMSRNRLNTFTLTYGNHTTYCSPLYPYYLEVPGYEKVRATNVSDDERKQNLATLRMISGKADDWGLKFRLGIWQQHPILNQKASVEGLEYSDLFDYGPRALKQLLELCPHISGLQFRLNYESGIKPDDQARFFGALFGVIRQCGRAVHVELRGKGLLPETIAQAQEKLFCQFAVSTKYWCEHMGQPYLATEIIPRDANNYRRYSYWDLLPNDRPYQFIIGLWTAGSQRVLSWCDPGYAARIATSSLLNGGPLQHASPQFQEMLGYEVMAPLSHQGFNNVGGQPPQLLAHKTNKIHRWDFERYWPFFSCFGAAGFHPQAQSRIMSAEFHRRFGKAASALQDALIAASRIVPLHTATHAPSASIFAYWPELESGGLTDWNIRIPTGDPGRFASIQEFAQNVGKGTSSGKTTPLEVGMMLDESAAQALQLLEKAKAQSTNSAEFQTFETDIQILAALGRYHASRRRAGVCYALFSMGKGGDWIEAATTEMNAALEQWKTLVKWSDGYFFDHLEFNEPPHQIGHWKDELPLLEEENSRMARIAALWKAGPPFPPPEKNGWTQRNWEWKNENGQFSRRPGKTNLCGPLGDDMYESHDGQYAVATPEWLLSKLPQSAPLSYSREWLYPTLRAPITMHHTPPASCRGDSALTLECAAPTDSGVEKIIVHYRPMIQTSAWQRAPMQSISIGTFRAEIPSKGIVSNWPFQYAFELFGKDGASQFWPDWKETQPYYIVPVKNF